jgi:hypothetical protein
MASALPLHLEDRKAERLGVAGCRAAVIAIYRQGLKVTALPANLHECSRIAAKFTVRPEVDVKLRRRQSFGVKT